MSSENTGRMELQPDTIAVDVIQARADMICEFLEVALHCILSSRKIYPELAFTKKIKYNIPVQIAIHPGVASYLRNCIKAIHPLILKDEVDSVVVSIIDASQKPVEQFVFDVMFPEDEEAASQLDACLIDIEQGFRDFCLKINTVGSVLKNDTKGCSFAIHIHTKHSAAERTLLKDDPENKSFPWIKSDKNQFALEKSQLVPLKAMETPLCKVQLYVTENQKSE